VIAAVIGAVAVLAVAGWLAWPSSTNSGGDDSYNAGYDWAYRNGKPGFSGANGAVFLGVHRECVSAATGDAPVQGLDSQEWTRGCEDAFNKMGFATPTPTGPTVDCSEPENARNGNCF
jgi:hypothetical protein